MASGECSEADYTGEERLESDSWEGRVEVGILPSEGFLHPVECKQPVPEDIPRRITLLCLFYMIMLSSFSGSLSVN